MSPRVDATIQARIGSSRLPGKVLLPVAGRPLLARIVERIRRASLVDRVIIATSDSTSDDPIEALAAEIGALVFRGSEDDVLGRVAGALDAFGVDVHVEFQGDNAVPDAAVIDDAVRHFLAHEADADYVSTGLRTTYPPGSEVAVYRARTLKRALAEWRDLPREHVGPHIYKRPELFRSVNLDAPTHLNRPDMHLEVDTREDYEVVCALYEHFLPDHPAFTLAEAVAFVDASGICDRNRGVERRWRAYRQQ